MRCMHDILYGVVNSWYQPLFSSPLIFILVMSYEKNIQSKNNGLWSLLFYFSTNVLAFWKDNILGKRGKRTYWEVFSN